MIAIHMSSAFVCQEIQASSNSHSARVQHCLPNHQSVIMEDCSSERENLFWCCRHERDLASPRADWLAAWVKDDNDWKLCWGGGGN